MKLSKAIQQYGAMKQMMGISFKEGMKILQAFQKHTGDRPIRTISRGQVLNFLDRSILSETTWLRKYRSLEVFFEYWLARGELSEWPMPVRRQPGTARAFIPYIYSILELRQLLHYAALKRPARNSREFGPQTFYAMLLFLYGTGSRINEMLALKYEDVDPKHGTVTFRPDFANRTRTIPIGRHLSESLKKYNESVDRSSAANCKHFFAGMAGNAIRPVALTLSFQTIRRKAGITRRGEVSRQPRVQDLRRTFAVHCMRSWLKQGKDLRTMLPALGAYLGHVSLTSTEAYLSVTPERFMKHLSHLSPPTCRRLP
jgi:integrase/recombinase XerD